MGSTQKILELIPTILTIKVIGKVTSKFPKTGDFQKGEGFSKKNKKNKQRV